MELPDGPGGVPVPLEHDGPEVEAGRVSRRGQRPGRPLELGLGIGHERGAVPGVSGLVLDPAELGEGDLVVGVAGQDRLVELGRLLQLALVLQGRRLVEGKRDLRQRDLARIGRANPQTSNQWNLLHIGASIAPGPNVTSPNVTSEYVKVESDKGGKMSIASQDSGKKTGYLRIATEEAYLPQEIPGLYRKLIEEKTVNDPGFLSQWGYFLGNAEKMQKLARRLVDIGEGRIRDMDSTGIARQILSIASPGVQIFDAATGTSLATSFNDALAQAIAKHPDRFSGLGAIAPQNPAAAAKELERCVTRLGLKGAIINSNTQGEYLDNPKFWDILAAAEALDVPIYLHPATPPARMIGPLIESGLEGAFYGFAVETSVHLLRMIMNGIFDRFPKLQIVAGHAGEGLPFGCGALITSSTTIRRAIAFRICPS